MICGLLMVSLMPPFMQHVCYQVVGRCVSGIYSFVRCVGVPRCFERLLAEQVEWPCECGAVWLHPIPVLGGSPLRPVCPVAVPANGQRAPTCHFQAGCEPLWRLRADCTEARLLILSLNMSRVVGFPVCAWLCVTLAGGCVVGCGRAFWSSVRLGMLAEGAQP